MSSSTFTIVLSTYFFIIQQLLFFQMLSVTETETLAAYMKPPSRYGGGGGAGGLDDNSGGPAKGFVVRDAPWNAAGNKVTTKPTLFCRKSSIVIFSDPELCYDMFVPGS